MKHVINRTGDKKVTKLFKKHTDYKVSEAEPPEFLVKNGRGFFTSLSSKPTKHTIEVFTPEIFISMIVHDAIRSDYGALREMDDGSVELVLMEYRTKKIK